MDWQGLAAIGALTIVIIGIIFGSGKIFQDHVNTKDRVKKLEDDVEELKKRDTAVEVVTQAVRGLEGQIIELRHDLRELFVSATFHNSKKREEE